MKLPAFTSLALASLVSAVAVLIGADAQASAVTPVAADNKVPALTPCTAAPSGLVSWWPGDGNAHDITDGNDGTLQGGAGFGTGVVGLAFAMDGFDDFVTVGNPANLHLGTSDFTVDAWVYFDSLVSPPAPPGSCSDVGCDLSIVSKMAGTDWNVDGWRLLKQMDNRFWFCLGSPSNGCTPWAPTTVRSSTIATPGVWYHVAGVKSSEAISIYVQGSLEESKALPSFTDTDSADVLIGYGIVESLMYGRIDEVEIFNRALAAPEIQAIYDAGSAGKCKSPAVGGIAELPDIGGASGGEAPVIPNGSGRSFASLAVLIAVIVTASLLVSPTVWYTRWRRTK